MKVFLRFLKQGLVEAETPNDFETMTDKEKLEWASIQLANLSDKEIINAMADFGDPGKNGYFDETTQASAIEKGEGEDITDSIIQTEEWKIFSTGDHQIIA